MLKNDIDIKTFLDIPEWEKVQDYLAKLTGTAIIVIDYKGTPVSKHSERTDFCTCIRENPVSRKRCFKCDALAGLEATRSNEPFIYLCHCGIVDVAVPVAIGDRYLGAVMFGQVKIPSDETDVKVEHLISEISSFSESDPNTAADLLEKYNRIPTMDYSKIVDTANLINSFVNYLINRLSKMKYNILAADYFKQKNPAVLDTDDEKSTQTLARLSSLESSSLKRYYSENDDSIPFGSQIYPAVAYINENRGEMVRMKDMAMLCHLSPSYFSKVFLREAGENYIDYLNRKKVGWAKQRLSATVDSVTNIAFELGYQDTSYFVKVFKKYEGITPNQYRKHMKQDLSYNDTIHTE